MKAALTVAGSDSSGGAGIQADIKTFAAHGVYGMSVITSVTSQKLDAVFTDIFPDSVKIGMVSSAEIIKSIADALKKYSAKNIVLDTVMVSTSGSPLLREESVKTLTEVLFPLADIITPNLYEAKILSGFEIKSADDMVRAAKMIYSNYGTAVLLKGGHLAGDASDLLYDGEETWFCCEKINNPNTHGTGCTLSSAIAANLALGHDIKTAVGNAKKYVTGAIRSGLNIGKGRGPLDHMWNLI